MKRTILTLDSIIRAKFVCVDVLDQQDGTCGLRVTPTNDPGTEPISLRITETRAKELGLVAA